MELFLYIFFFVCNLVKKKRKKKSSKIFIFILLFLLSNNFLKVIYRLIVEIMVFCGEIYLIFFVNFFIF